MPHQLQIPGTDVYLWADSKLNPLQVLMAAYRFHDGYAKCKDFPSKHWLYEQIVRAIWGEHNPYKPFVWHPWAHKMNEAVHAHKYLCVVGSGNSGKSDFFGLWGLVNWLVDPQNTLVLMTSTSIKDSKKRIWGAMCSYYMAAGGDNFFPGHLVDSLHQIRTVVSGANSTDRAGIAIIAGEKKKEKESVGKLIGLKSPRMFLIADELPELSESLLEAALSNLSLNPNFQMVGIGNLWSMYDPLGTFARPKAGWSAVGPNDEEWETERGYCIRFDGEKSPNVLAGQDLYPFIYKKRDLDEQRRQLGANSVGYWRMCRSFVPPIGSENVIYSEADLVSGGSATKPLWMVEPIRLAAMDPSYTMGGDRTVALFGFLGMDTKGKQILAVEEAVVLREDASITVPRSQQIVQQFIDLCTRKSISPDRAAVDATGAGRVLHDIIVEKWDRKVLAVQFGGAPSDRMAPNSNQTAKDLYDRRVSELWHVGVEYLRAGQLKNIPFEVANEMKARHYEYVKSGGSKIKVETKSDMKARIGFSPDFADSYFILLELARSRFGFNVAPGGTAVRSSNRNDFNRIARDYDEVHARLYTEKAI